MVAHKHIVKIIAAVMAAAVCLCLCAAAFSDRLTEAVGGGGVSMEYETALFGTDEIMSVNIIMDEAEWEAMLSDAISEEYRQCDVEINGTTFYRVGIRPKGNTSLTSIANDPTTDRYSFKLEFDRYVEGQTCFGLDKLVLNNNYADATGMKEALIYDMYRWIGADASLYNYAKISVNGEYWGVYLALEAVEDSFLLRNYGVQSGELYKPEGLDMGGGPGGGDAPSFSPPDGEDAFAPPTQPQDGEERPAPPDGGREENGENAQADAPGFPGGGAVPDFPGGGFSMGSGGGADLNYSDDDPDSYETIWDGEITDTTKADHKRVVKALKNIASGTELETYMDVENLVRYMAVHIFSVNEDSLSGNMAHNYYLYEAGGQLNLIPWDYNLSFGGMGGMSGSASDVVNSAIDNAFSGTEFFDTLLEDETYHAQYYAQLRRLVEEYIDGGEFDRFYTRVRGQLDELMQTDPTAFYSYEEYLAAVETLYDTVKLRARSIEGQLDGTIPSTKEAQQGSDALIDASSLDLSVMGSMNMGGGRGAAAEEAMRPEDGDRAERDFSDAQPPSRRGAPGGGGGGPSEPSGSGADGAPWKKSLPTYGICFAVLLAALLAASRFRRRRG